MNQNKVTKYLSIIEDDKDRSLKKSLQKPIIRGGKMGSNLKNFFSEAMRKYSPFGDKEECQGISREICGANVKYETEYNSIVISGKDKEMVHRAREALRSAQ